MKGEVQPRRCNDVLFAIMFYAHLGAMIFVTATFAPRMVGEVAESAGNMNNDRDLLEEDEGVDMVGDGEVKEMNGMHQSSGNKFATYVAKATNSILSYTIIGSEISNHRDLEENDDVTGTNDMGDLMLLLSISALIALVISSTALSVMISHAESLIKFALLFNIVSTAVVSY